MTAVTVAFYEHIPTYRKVREEMPRWFQYDEVAKNKQVFSYLIGEASFADLVALMAKDRHRYVPRPRPRPAIRQS